MMTNWQAYSRAALASSPPPPVLARIISHSEADMPLALAGMLGPEQDYIKGSTPTDNAIIEGKRPRSHLATLPRSGRRRITSTGT